MTDNTSIILVGALQEEEAILRGQLYGVADIVASEPDPQRGLDAVRANSPSIALLYLDHQPQRILGLAREISGLNGSVPMIVSRNRDPDRILQAMRSGAKEFAFLQEGNEDVRRAIKELSDIKPKNGVALERRAKIVSVFGCKGGSGSTTIALNLAGALTGSNREKSVVVLDLDFQMGDVLTFLDIQSRYTWHELINNVHRLDRDLLHQSLTLHSCGIHAVAQSDAVEDADHLHPKKVLEAISFLELHFDYIVVDGLRDFSELAIGVLDRSDRILVTITQDIPSLKNAHRCLAIFRQMGYGADKLKLVINRFLKRAKLDPDSVCEALGLSGARTVANDFPTVVTALNEGGLLIDRAPRAKVTRDIVELVSAVEDAPAEAKKRGLLGLFGG